VSDALKNLKARMAYRAQCLRDPRYADPRRFPTAAACGSTAEYIKAYETLNAPRMLRPLNFTLGVQP
jgi:hypothetical protein